MSVPLLKEMIDSFEKLETEQGVEIVAQVKANPKCVSVVHRTLALYNAGACSARFLMLVIYARAEVASRLLDSLENGMMDNVLATYLVSMDISDQATTPASPEPTRRTLKCPDAPMRPQATTGMFTPPEQP